MTGSRKTIARGFAVIAVGLTAACWAAPIPIIAGNGFAAVAAVTGAPQSPAVQAAVNAALASVNPSLTGAARAKAVQEALAQVTAQEIASAGPSVVSAIAAAAVNAGVPSVDIVAGIMPAAVNAGAPVTDVVDYIETGAVAAGGSPTQIAEAIITLGAQDHYLTADIGTGLGDAAAQISATNTTGADQIARVVAYLGTEDLRKDFASAVTANGGSTALADLGSKSPDTVGGIGIGNGGFGGTYNFGNNNIEGSGGTTLSPCNTQPSCN